MVEGDGLENRYTLTGIEGSNPSLSAILFIILLHDCLLNCWFYLFSDFRLNIMKRNFHR